MLSSLTVIAVSWIIPFSLFNVWKYQSFDSKMSSNKNLNQWFCWFDFNQRVLSWSQLTLSDNCLMKLDWRFPFFAFWRTLNDSKFPYGVLVPVSLIYTLFLSDIKYTGFPSCDIMSDKPATEYYSVFKNAEVTVRDRWLVVTWWISELEG